MIFIWLNGIWHLADLDSLDDRPGIQNPRSTIEGPRFSIPDPVTKSATCQTHGRIKYLTNKSCHDKTSDMAISMDVHRFTWIQMAREVAASFHLGPHGCLLRRATSTPTFTQLLTSCAFGGFWCDFADLLAALTSTFMIFFAITFVAFPVCVLFTYACYGFRSGFHASTCISYLCICAAHLFVCACMRTQTPTHTD